MKKVATKFIEPQEKSTGFKIKRIFDNMAQFVVSKSVHTTFQFVPISETLKALFSSADFEETYINFNSQKDHDCNQATYTNFCCGELFKSSDFFKMNPLAIQLKLFEIIYGFISVVASMQTIIVACAHQNGWIVKKWSQKTQVK